MTFDVRRSGRAPVRAAVAALAAVNRRHPWSHNEHFHGWVVRRLPGRRRRALDVGCGTGLLVERLRRHVTEVVGVDPDATMAAAARARCAGDPAVTVRHAALADVTGEDGSFDVVTMVAVLHHLPLEPALEHAGRLLAPGGRLLVVGLARVASPLDAAVDLASALLNPLVGLVKHPRPLPARSPEGPAMPVRDPAETYGEVAAAARRVLPGARFRRRLFFRYTLEWTRPPAGA